MLKYHHQTSMYKRTSDNTFVATLLFFSFFFFNLSKKMRFTWSIVLADWLAGQLCLNTQSSPGMCLRPIRLLVLCFHIKIPFEREREREREGRKKKKQSSSRPARPFFLYRRLDQG